MKNQSLSTKQNEVGTPSIHVTFNSGELENLVTDHQAAISLLVKYGDDLTHQERYLVERLVKVTCPSLDIIQENLDSLISLNHHKKLKAV